jgi:hypothetical protein
MTRVFLVLSLYLAGFSPALADVHVQHPERAAFACAAGIVGGIWAFIWGFFELRKKRIIEDTPTSTIRAIAPGMAEVIGKPVEWKVMKGPFTKDSCVYYEYSVEQYVRRGKHSRWETIKKEDTQSQPFCLKDETGQILVFPNKAQTILAESYSLTTGMFTDIPAHVDQFLGQKGISCQNFFGFQKKLRFTERNIKMGEAVYALGVCQSLEGRGAQPPEGTMDHVCLAQGKGSREMFILSDESQRKLVSSFGTHAFFGIFGGVAILGGCLYGLLKVLGYY